MASRGDWGAVARRNARSVQTTIGWIFWDPGAVARYAELGLPAPVGYIAAHLRMARPDDPVLSGWHAVNCLREWRGDTHWALIAAAGLNGVEASIIHNAWLGYETDWLALSRGTDAGDLDAAWSSLASKGLADAAARVVAPEGVALRQRIEDDTDRLTTLPWELLEEAGSARFAADFEPPCELLLKRVDLTAGPLYQPASRVR